MTYSQVIEYLFSQYPQFQKIGALAYKPGLGNIESLCSMLNNPQDKLKIVHVAGTNGKGSTCNLLASVLQESGYKVGLFTSPHLVDFRERIRINGQMIPESEVISFVAHNKVAFEAINASFFEWSTALAFYFFEKEQVDIVILETGLGGRLDSTNIVKPILSVITQIGLDHVQFLGDTLEKIAAEKAGIIKGNTPCIIAYGNETIKNVFIEKANAIKSPLHIITEIPKDNTTGLLGDYQRMNSATVYECCLQLSKMGFLIPSEKIVAGLKNVQRNTGFRGRWEQLQTKPTIIADIGHNVNGITQIVHQLASERKKFENVHLVFGMVADKELSKIVELLPKDAFYYLCAPKIQRAFPVVELALHFGEFNHVSLYSSCAEAFISAREQAQPNDLIFVGGSNFVVAEIIENFFNKSLEV